MDTAYVRENPPPLNLVMQNLSTTAKLALAYKKECSSCTLTSAWLVVSTHLKNISQIGSFPQVGVKIKNIWNHHLVCPIVRNVVSTGQPKDCDFFLRRPAPMRLGWKISHFLDPGPISHWSWWRCVFEGVPGKAGRWSLYASFALFSLPKYVTPKNLR